jgi:deoxycytidine triphosphate deaminase
MYLSSTDIQELLRQELLVIRGSEEHKFDANHQIGPCSVDIRISNEFWKFRNLERIDLLDIHRFSKESESYEKIVLDSEQNIDILPNEIVLTHALEYIETPEYLAGMLVGRSRYSRLGLSVHCTGNFINPGYRGYMPLQLVNNNSFPIRIYPYMDLAQIVFVLLSSEPDINYQDLPRTIFKVDRGGPSLWFLDKNIQDLAHRLSQSRLPQTVELLIKKELEKSQERTLNQIEKYLSKVSTSNFESEEVRARRFENQMRNFEPRDEIRDRKTRIVFYINGIVLGADLGVFIPALFSAMGEGNFQNPTFWSSLAVLLFSLFIMWLTFDIKYIGG